MRRGGTAFSSKCKICGKAAPFSLPVCPECSKKDAALEIATSLHPPLYEKRVEGCNLCSNKCSGIALCGKPEYGKLTYYEDPLPTNCCNAWFCNGSKLTGTNLAVFYYGCNFDCLYCQNWTHKYFEDVRTVSVDELLRAAKNFRVRCVCHFGGSPEPQLPFALKFSRKALEFKEDLMICWEWNGAGNTSLALKAAELSSRSGGTVKFDLKAWNPNLHVLLTGRDNERVKDNFERIYDKHGEVLSATTLLVPYYVDEEEVEGIARFISSFSTEIPYSLLVFHPDYRMSDFPVTPVQQVKRCYKAAKKHLKNVNIGNLHLLGL
ncbi:radical SAM protein [Archaeoglobus fulgidus]|uniref:Pyruvate formate-lyase activating enzyme (Act-1) n=2 Tax=Archaeoglobus fulgidus TaxID=2234 RepID=O30119_ARCFU|nr:radical SAM protein [Archaeoglobus fulgidus]AAB91111.1 pyruvate formate-lyase activating enzyme (act-1) [Archaeoglobus fulgidus DSM 4304]AIG96955.1 Pyruvate-formate lyase-activating enzyme [Archaeoglobus fulgidus DSM 8774]